MTAGENAAAVEDRHAPPAARSRAEKPGALAAKVAGRPDIFGDSLRRREYNEKLSSALEIWPEIQEALPREWLFANPEMTVPVDFDLDMAYQFTNATTSGIHHEQDCLPVRDCSICPLCRDG